MAGWRRSSARCSEANCGSSPSSACPTFALALAITTVSTYLPVLAEDFSDSSIVIGLLIGGEGLIALWLPLVVGSWSDRLRTPLGSRLPFILAATPALVVALALLGFVALDRRGGDRRRAVLRGLLRRLRALPRAVPGPRRRRDRRAGAEQPGDLPRARDLPRAGRRRAADLDLRAAALRGRGGRGRLSSMGAFCVAGVRHRRRERPRCTRSAVGEVVRRVADLVRGHRELQAFLVANALWELALSALKTFVVLYVTKTLGLSLAGSSLAVGVAAAVVLVGALVERQARRQRRPRARDARRAGRLRARPDRPVRQHRRRGSSRSPRRSWPSAAA